MEVDFAAAFRRQAQGGGVNRRRGPPLRAFGPFRKLRAVTWLRWQIPIQAVVGSRLAGSQCQPTAHRPFPLIPVGNNRQVGQRLPTSRFRSYGSHWQPVSINRSIVSPPVYSITGGATGWPERVCRELPFTLFQKQEGWRPVVTETGGLAIDDSP